MKRILVVDDEPAVVATLAYVFSTVGHTTVGAANGAEALRLLEAETFDAAVIDLIMPVADGFSVCQRFCESARHRGVAAPRVWLMTGAYTEDGATRARAIGAQNLLRKPFDVLAFLKELDADITAPAAAPGGTIVAAAPAPELALGAA